MENLALQQENKDLLKQIATLQAQLRIYQDNHSMTALDDFNTFCHKTEVLLHDAKSVKFGIVYINIERFKLFNEWFGRGAGDRFIRFLSQCIEQKAKEEGGLCAHLGADTFAMLIPLSMDQLDGLEKEILRWMQDYELNTNFLPVIGVYLIEDRDWPAAIMCDKAMLAAEAAKGNYNHRLVVYDANMSRILAEEQQLLADFKKGLLNREFIIYIQPKCNMRSGKITGGEALVRWQHPEKGFLMPGTFIPVLEKNNLIFQLDCYIWEETCRVLCNWKAKGYPQVPISVNVSRLDVFHPMLCETLKNLVQQYDLDPKLLELELTETAYTQDTDQLIEIVRKLRELGFTILMDDFGSGYSSLNMLKEMDVDVLKFDMRFLEMNSGNARRGSNILESVVQMAKWLELQVIAEGVETKIQIDLLLSIGCEYGQGYHFYKPMAVDTFEEILRQENMIDTRGIVDGLKEEIRMDKFLSTQGISEAFINQILGGVAIYESFPDGTLRLVQVNDGYYRVTGCTPADLVNVRERISDKIHPDDKAMVNEKILESEKYPTKGSEVTFRRYRENGELMYMRMRIFFFQDKQNRKRFYAAVSDATEEVNTREKLHEAQEKLHILLGNTEKEDAFSAKLDFLETKQKLAVSEKRLLVVLRQAGMDVWEYDPHLELLHIFNTSEVSISARLGMPNVLYNYPQCVIDKGYVAPESLQSFLQFIKDASSGVEGVSATIHFISPKNEDFWVHLAGDSIQDAQGNVLYTVGSMQDVTKQKQQELEHMETGKFLEAMGKRSIYKWRVNLSRDSIIGNDAGEKWTQETGVTENTVYSEAVIQVVNSVIVPEYKSELRRFLDKERMLLSFKQGIKHSTIQYQRYESGQPKWMEVVYHMVQPEGMGDIFAYIHVMDIDQQKRQELDLLYKAQRDSLTDLYNRQTAITMMHEAINETVLEKDTAALFIIDLDNFKQINDTYGHIYGDAVLSENAAVLKKLFREQDIICRLGGDEFMIYCKHLSKENATAKAKQICSLINHTYTSGEHKVVLTASVGIAMTPRDGIDFETLYAKADIALYEVKTKNKNYFCFYDGQMMQMNPTGEIKNKQNETTMHKDFFNHVEEYVFKMLYESTDSKRAITVALEMISRGFHADMVSFVVIDAEKQQKVEVFEWILEQYQPIQSKFLELLFQNSGEAFSLFNEEGIFLADQVSQLPLEFMELAQQIGMKFFVAYQVKQQNGQEGYLCMAGIEEDSYYTPTDLPKIRTIAEIISTFVEYEHIKSQQQSYIKAMEDILNLQDVGCYVINQDYEIVYLNRYISNHLPSVEIGKKCYKALRGNDQPCERCIYQDLVMSDKDVVQIMFENGSTNIFPMRISASWIDWPNMGRCAICTSVSMA